VAGWPAARAAVRATAVPAEVSRTARASPVLPAAQQTLEADQAHRPRGDRLHWGYAVSSRVGRIRWAPVVTEGRDRDAAGRPRQERPRDALGRPLPYGATGVEPVSEQALPPAQALDYARTLVAAGRPFAAHEVLEARWKAGPEQERDLWQGLAQLCVALTHAARGNTAGSVRLLERGASRVQQYAVGGGPEYGLDLTAVVACARRLAAGRDENAGDGAPDRTG